MDTAFTKYKVESKLGMKVNNHIMKSTSVKPTQPTLTIYRTL